ncbi:heavy metal translocating P-type ATPase [Desulfobulbus alkaliphilus]|uniref:heavy metal translocating P-type ATPase n=1 Tax=Desulfobulbus alkaliphilus TaxID=869814 RepID=UPI001964ED6F|nr:cation-translocating P-type ATPase [Desulfobulbus alkaliphilus]MBM9538708.1 cation-translocating P-type ATPase [Desulfobulbus alkaliphilus]
MRFFIRHRRPYRTRILFPRLRGRDEHCARVQASLAALPGVSAVQVRSASGAVILEHPAQAIPVRDIITRTVAALASSATAEPDNRCPLPAARAGTWKPEKRGPRQSHVPGPILLLSGLYLLYLSFKRLMAAVGTATVAPAPLLSLPTLVTLGLSLPIQRQALDNLRRSGRPDMGLISTGLLYLSLFTGNVLTAFTVFWLFNLSSWIEDRIRIRTRQAVRAMLSGSRTSAWLVRDGMEIEVHADSLVPGDLIALRRGSTVPADGVVVAGAALIDEAALTGEDVPVLREADHPVLAGTVVTGGDIRVRVEQAGEATRLAAIIRLIEAAENDPGALEQAGLRFSRAMVPLSLGLAGAAFLLTGDLLRAMAVLIITCPCAPRLATSVAVTTAMGQAASRGILVKGGLYIETAGQVDILVLDKTGTLTDRSAEVTAVRLFDHRLRPETVLQLAASALHAWPHPLSRAVTARAVMTEVPLLARRQSELVVGRGVRAVIDDRIVLAGSARFMADNNITTLEADSPHQGQPAPSAGCIFVARDGRLLGVIDTIAHIRGDLARDFQRCRELGVRRIVLLTGDHQTAAQDMARRFSFDEVRWQQSPEDKAAWISAWKQAHPGDTVAMVGDGINDTPALAAADLGFAVGEGGADVTVEYADIVLRRGGVDRVADTLALGRTTLQSIRESYALAIGGNAVVLLATTLGLLAPVSGALAHNLITIGVVGRAAVRRTVLPARRFAPCPESLPFA